MSDEPTLANELELDFSIRRVVLRDFDYRLEPLGPIDLVNVAPGVFLPGARELDGLGLVVRARDTGLVVSLRFDRSEFVNVATSGLAMLDSADAAGENERG